MRLCQLFLSKCQASLERGEGKLSTLCKGFSKLGLPSHPTSSSILSNAMSLVECPACNNVVDESFLNKHLDSDCKELAPPKSQQPPGPKSQITLFDIGKKRNAPEPNNAVSPIAVPSSASPSPPNAPVAQQQHQQPTEPPPKKLKLGGLLQKKLEDDLTAPLAELARPKTLEEFFGQEAVVGEDSLLRDLIEAGRCPSLILWGGPGCGKTTLARLIGGYAPFYRELSAVKDSVAELKTQMEKAAGFKRLHPDERRLPVIFLDEIHRFNRAQQDALLGAVERGDFTLIAATTENPSFRIVSALLSRCRVIVLKSLAPEVLEQIISRASEIQAKRLAIEIHWDDQVLHRLATACDGDARSALNAVQLVVEASLAGQERKKRKLEESREDSTTTVTEDNTAAESADVKEAPKTVVKVTAERVLSALQKSHLLYDSSGDGHYDTISALHKSIRGGDADAAIYWMGRMLFAGEDPLFIVRRLIRCASEDIGLADPQALVLATSTWNACQYIGMPECGVCIAQLVTYLARAPKSIEVYKALGKVREAVTTEIAYPVPLHLRNAPTGLMKDLGYGAGYKYTPDFAPEDAHQEYFPPEMKGRKFF